RVELARSPRRPAKPASCAKETAGVDDNRSFLVAALGVAIWEDSSSSPSECPRLESHPLLWQPRTLSRLALAEYTARHADLAFKLEWRDPLRSRATGGIEALSRNKCGELHDCLLATPGGLCWPFDRGGPACCRGFDEGRVPAKRSARIDEIGGYKVLDGTSQTLACRGDHDPSAKLCKSQARLQGHGRQHPAQRR